MRRQVGSAHYEFSRYMSPERWSSIWHQINEVISFQPTRVLEIGIGSGIFKAAGVALGIVIDAVDIDVELQPDFVASCTSLPFIDRGYDVTCAFQVLEHLPYEDSVMAFAELARVAKKAVVISLPDSRKTLRFAFNLPPFLSSNWTLHVPTFRRAHLFDGQHHWELERSGFKSKKVAREFAVAGACRLARIFRVPSNPYHVFLVFEK